MMRAATLLRILPAALLLPAVGMQALAAPISPASWIVSGRPNKPITRGATFSLTLSAHIQPGWHIYALDEPDGGPVATQVGLAEGDPLTILSVDEPRPIMVPDPVLHQPTGMFQSAVDFTLHLRAGRKPVAADAVSHIIVRYQCCNDQVCLPPHSETVSLPLKGILE